MLTQHTSAQQRRALNQIWNAAGEYGFDPLFLAQTAGGAPDLYMNTIVGCVRRWYGAEMPRALFGAWAEDRRQAMLENFDQARSHPDAADLERARAAVAVAR